ncbi:type I-E CRISPR-associated protein Cse1/CasA, partial [Streptomyces durbertensis]
MTDHEPQRGSAAASFDLTTQPWIPVLHDDGTQSELSLRDVFANADDLRRLIGDVPTQEFALLRLLLAVVHDALDGGPADTDEWAELWADKNCFAPVADYLTTHREAFDLLHPQRPFFQVAGLRTARDEVFELNRIVADVPAGAPYLSSRMPGVDRLEFGEAARWLVHAHAFDTSGIKTGLDGDDRVKGGKVYPLGVGWAGTLGGVFIEGGTLRETLLLNLIARDHPDVRQEADDRPAWRRDPYGPGPAGRVRPTGLRDLYTWQSRRLLLHHDRQAVRGVVLGYGDPLAPRNMQVHEPMTAWRRSKAQEKKHGVVPCYLPREHDPSRSAWRGLEALLADRAEADHGPEAPPSIRPRVIEWVSHLVSDAGVLPRRFHVRARTVGVFYGTQQSVIDEVVDDHVSMDVVLLHREDREYARQAVAAVGDADDAVRVLGDLATDLADAAGLDAEPRRAGARDLGYAALDEPYRLWLRNLSAGDDPYAARDHWRREVHKAVLRLGGGLVREAGEAAWQGRTVKAGSGTVWLNAASAERWFRFRLRKALGDPNPTP